MKNETILKKSILLLLALALLAALAGCGQETQLKRGRKLIKQYVLRLSRDATLLDCHLDELSLDAEEPVTSDYVMGSFRVGETQYEIAADTETGQIWTTERTRELSDACIRLVEERLGLDPANSVGVSSVTLTVPAWHTAREEWPEQTTYLGSLVPVDIPDMDAYARQMLESEDARTLFYLISRGEKLSAKRWHKDQIEDWKSTEIMVYSLGEDEALPSQETASRLYVGNYPGERVRLTQDDVFYRPREEEKEIYYN